MAIIIASAAAFWFGLRAALRTDYPLLPVDSGRMEPILCRSDLIIVRGVSNACDIVPGDIIVFHKPNDGGELVVLRAVEKTIKSGSCSFRTQGDIVSGHNPDNWWVKESDIVGTYVGKVPWLGHIPLFMREVAFPFLSTPAGFLIVILVIIGLMLLDYIPLKRERAEA